MTAAFQIGLEVMTWCGRLHPSGHKKNVPMAPYFSQCRESVEF
jgi:hypothetical protein